MKNTLDLLPTFRIYNFYCYI